MFFSSPVWYDKESVREIETKHVKHIFVGGNPSNVLKVGPPPRSFPAVCAQMW